MTWASYIKHKQNKFVCKSSIKAFFCKLAHWIEWNNLCKNSYRFAHQFPSAHVACMNKVNWSLHSSNLQICLVLLWCSEPVHAHEHNKDSSDWVETCHLALSRSFYFRDSPLNVHHALSWTSTDAMYNALILLTVSNPISLILQHRFQFKKSLWSNLATGKLPVPMLGESFVRARLPLKAPGHTSASI